MTQAKIVIIGSGVSGLAAANELINQNITDIIILEAQNRVGGRTYTIPHDNGHIEIGAQWLHGKEGNPIYSLCKSLQLLNEKTKTVFGDVFHYATQDGQPVNEDFVDKITKKVNDLFDQIGDEIESLDNDKSVGEILDEKFNKHLNEYDDIDERELVRAIYEARLKEERTGTACHNLNELSAWGWNTFEDSKGDNMINLEKGYGGLVDHLKSNIPANCIRLNESVEKIIYPESEESDDQMVKIITHSTANGQKTTYYAQFCLCTIPLGRLKMTYHELFEPSLPPAKSKAIERLGFGNVDKFFFIFDGPVFDSHVQGLQILWKNNLDIQLDSASKLSMQDTEFYKTFLTFEVLPDRPNILYSFLTGEDAEYSENLTEERLIEIVYEILSKCFPSLNIPYPKKLIRSLWATNEFTVGSYSFIKMGSSVKDIEALAEPLNSKIFFAGEATSLEFFSTVHGAYEAALRETKNILKAMNEK